MYEEAHGEVEGCADDEAGEDAEGGLEGWEVLDFLEAEAVLVFVGEAGLMWRAYKRLENSSIELMTAKDKAMVAQMLENVAFFQRELGIRAGRPFCTWW